jgi:hypothetical protein
MIAPFLYRGPTPSPPSWVTLVDIELTGANTQSGLGANGTYTLVNATDTPAGQNVSLSVQNQDVTNPPTVATLTNGVGLDVTITPTSTTQQQKNFAFRIDNIPGVSIPDLDLDQLVVDVFITPTNLASNTDSIICELAQTNPPDGSTIAVGVQLYRTSSTDYRRRLIRRATTIATVSTGTTVKTSLPTLWCAQFYGMGKWWNGGGEEGNTLKNPRAVAKQASHGCASEGISDSEATLWGSTLYVTVSFIAHTNAAVVSGIIKRIVIRQKQPTIS